ncbi:Protein PGR [Cladobotryum mycophilum]|uniref:Protein PGR n=1 Tax=Cladobotryum mycophilum TaxID=491253 RepID=A0ABR0S5R7_9HYPO
MKPVIAIPAIFLLVARAWKKKSLTPGGIFAAILTAVAHAYHPWNLPFALLVVFFLAGTRVTHIKEQVKANLTMHAKGSSGGEGPRTHVQVFANSLMASILCLLHAHQLNTRAAALSSPGAEKPEGTMCFSWGGDILVVGIIANYAAVTADTFSSELGILSKSDPRLIISPTLRKVPRGTNGGVTLLGLGAGLLGSIIVVTASMLFLPTCNDSTSLAAGGGAPWTGENRRLFMGLMVIWGALGSVLDSVLGAVFQRSVKDVRTGKIVEGEGGVRVLVSDIKANQVVGGSTKRADAKAAILHGEGSNAIEHTDESAVDENLEVEDKFNPKNKHRKSSFGDERPSRVVENGLDWLDNNDINFLMAVTMSIGGMAAASWYWGIPLQDILTP